MVFLRAVLLSAVLVVGTQATWQCENGGKFPSEKCHDDFCTTAIAKHVEEELRAAFKYIAMGAYFAQTSVAKPGAAKFLLGAASEERSHAAQMLDYLNMRGIRLSPNVQFENSQADYSKWTDGGNNLTVYDGIKEALEMEITVTQLIYDVITECANDYHAADTFTDPILDEQHNGVRELQGLLLEYQNLLGGMTDDASRAMVEFVMDRKLLQKE